MQDEEMDDIIKDASDQHYPAYDDQAWVKMERLLDTHLPQKKDKRKYLLFLLLFLLIDAGLFFVLFNSSKHNLPQSAIVIKHQNNSNRISTGLNNVSLDLKTKNTQQQLPATNKKATDPLIVLSKDDNTNTHKMNKIRLTTKAKVKSHVIYGDAFDIATTVAQKNNNEQSTDINKGSNIADTITINYNKAANKFPDIVIANKKDTALNNKQLIAANIARQEKKKANGFKNNFAFTISAGPGFSYVGLDDFGKTTLTYGAGVSYRLAKKFAIRTGFYVTKKIYSANASNYHPPEWFWTYYPNLQTIAATCKVYEIPVTVSYDFAQSKKHSWFAAMGLTSYIMKQEVYNYFSKDANGQPSFINSATIDNKNKNIFSVLMLSGGYRYNINNSFSISAEPYIELPTNGIGFGKINLNSGGLLFTAIIKPFAHNK